MKQILQSFKTGEMWLADVPAPLCPAKGAVVLTAASFVSAGTERMLAEFARKGLVGKALQMPDQVRKVLRKMKTEGVFATLEKVQAKLDQPIPLGYSSAGVVVEAGRDSGFAVGDRVACGGAGTKLYSTADSGFKRLCLQNNLHLLDASVRHLGTDINYKVLENLYAQLKEHVEFHFLTPVKALNAAEDGTYEAETDKGTFVGRKCIISVGRSGSKWMESVCEALKIPTKSNRVDIGVRVELPAEVFAPITDELYESKIVYKTEKYQDKVRTFCMNPKGAVVNENTNGIVTVNGHSYEDPAKQTENTNFALLVSKHFTEPFKDSNGYGESIARLSNMLGGGVIVQRFGDLIRGQRSTPKRIEKGFMTPTLAATPGDLSLVMPKRILDGIIEMIYALDKIAPGTASDDTLLYGVEVKFYNMEVALDENLETPHKGLFVIGDGSGVTHSLSHASASGVYVARYLAENE